MSYDRLSRRSLFAAAIMIVPLLAGCQVRPLYSQADGNGERLAAVGFADPQNRVDQVLRNHLVFLTSGGAGESRNPLYEVRLSSTSTASSVIDTSDNDDNVSPTGVPQAGRVRVDATYSLTRIADGTVLKSGKRQVTALIDVSRQSFARLRAVRDAENRAARELAEFIRAEIAVALAREKPAQAEWQK